ncbi:MAG: calcium/sodium antiporter [Acidobacteria bacterium]|nr:calcium/sodium antiporter [Acidobacteriota bacterium]
MTLIYLVLGAGLVLLFWSADRFVDGAATISRIFRVSPLLIGMLLIGFFTSLPELVVSLLAAQQHHHDFALGNVIGSNIVNFSLVLGSMALVHPVLVHSNVIRKELPILLAITLLATLLMTDGTLSFADGWILLGCFGVLLVWSLVQVRLSSDDALVQEVNESFEKKQAKLNRAFFWLASGLLLMVVSSRMLVWGGLALATRYQISDISVSLSLVAFGTSLPELASSLAAIRRKEDDLALGNLLGSNLFNTLAVLGASAMVEPLQVHHQLMGRDLPLCLLLTLTVFLVGFRFKRTPRVNRIAGSGLFIGYFVYLYFVVS